MWINRAVKAALLGAVLSCMASGDLSAQSPTNCSYTILSSGGYAQATLAQALDAAKLDSYRFRNTPRTLHFDQGARVILFSASNLASRGCPVNGNLALPDNSPVDPNRVFTVHPTGVIMETVAPPVKQ